MAKAAKVLVCVTRNHNPEASQNIKTQVGVFQTLGSNLSGV
jgi:hypothetical protein